jgi:putative transposase
MLTVVRYFPIEVIETRFYFTKSMLVQGWYEFRRQYEYKQLWNGGLVVAVPAQYTSPDLSMLRSCIDCGYTNNADIVDAPIILDRGTPC